MANSSACNVIRVTTTGLIPGIIYVSAIKYIGASSGTASLRNASSTGIMVWEQSGSANWIDPHLFIEGNNGLYATITNGAVAYLYLSR